MWNLMHWEWCWYHLTCFHCSPNTSAAGIHNSLCSPLYHFLYPKFLARSWAQPGCMWSHHWSEAFSPALLGMSCLWRKLLKPLLTKSSSSMEEVSWREAKSAIAQGRPETCYFWDHTAGRASKEPLWSTFKVAFAVKNEFNYLKSFLSLQRD